MDKKIFDREDIDIAWCPGCGNFPLLSALKQALVELEIPPQQLLLVSGIGQAAKLPHYMRANVFNGLHGRSLPVATAAKAANPSLTVIADSGDGCMYGEGGNHFIHAIRRNPGIACLVHNNMVYGLTKGQASPTSSEGFRTPVQTAGVFAEPFNPVAVGVALDASFVARAFVGDREQTKELMKQAITHKGFAILDLFQPCVTFNRVNTYQWFKEHTYYLDESYDPTDRVEAFRKALEQDKFPLGVIYKSPPKATFEENMAARREGPQKLYEVEVNPERLRDLVIDIAGDVQRKGKERYQWSR